MKVKIVFGSDIRRWHAPEESKYEALIAFIQNTFNFPDEGKFFLQFEDDEGDRMTLSSANDLNDAFTIAEQEDRKSLKIFLIPISIDEARQDALSQFGGSVRSVAGSLDQFEVVSNPQSHADSSISGSIEVPELDDVPALEPSPEPEPRNLQEDLSDFLKNEAVSALLPDFVRGVVALLRSEQASFDVAMLQTASLIQFEAIEQHPFFEHRVKPNLDCISASAGQFIPVLLAFDDDHIVSIIPQLIETSVQMLSGSPDSELDVTPIFAALFPTWMAMMNENNPNGATVDLSHIFGCNDAAEAAAAMMCGAEKKDDEPVVHQGITCDMCNASPIQGARYKCCVCTDFDLCANCESTSTHNQEHPLLKLRRPCRGLSRARMHGLREMFGRGRFGGWRRFHHGDHHGHPPAFGPPPHHGPHHGPHGGRHHGAHGPPPHFPPFGHPPHHPRHDPRAPWGRWGFGPCGQQPQASCESTPAETASVCSDATVRTDCGRKLKAQFVEDVNIPDRSHYRPGLVLEKTWKMKNNGPNEWGDNCCLVFVKGCRNMTIEERFPVPNAAPSDVVDVSAMIRTPDTPNRYCAYYRLERDGNKFGPRVWVDIFVTTDQSKLGEADFSRKELKSLHRHEKLQKKQEKLAKKQAHVQAQLEKLNEQIEVARQPEGPSLNCMCGRKLLKIHHKKAYGPRSRINCDICGRLARKQDKIYHCEEAFNAPLHPEGYDLCEGCGQDQLRLAAKEQEVPEMKQDPVEEPVVEEPATEEVIEEVEVNPTAPELVEPAIVESGFPFQDELNTVMQMGFADEEGLKYLLMEYNGNVENVVQHLLSSS